MHSAEEIVVIVDNKVFIIEHIFPGNNNNTLPLKNLLRPNHVSLPTYQTTSSGLLSLHSKTSSNAIIKFP